MSVKSREPNATRGRPTATRLKPRRSPVQERAKERTFKILDTAARLLEEVGIDNLTTILIAERLKISVGSLYHYYPNKHAILHALGAKWLQEMTTTLAELERLDIEALSLGEFIDEAVDRLVAVYKRQRAILPLAQALWSIPDLRALDHEHDVMVIASMMRMFRRLGFRVTDNELNRLGRAWLETTHSLSLVIVEQHSVRAQRTTGDLKNMALALLESHRGEDGHTTRTVESP